MSTLVGPSLPGMPADHAWEASAHAGRPRLRLAPRTPWLLLYIAANVIALVIIVRTGVLMGDAAGWRVERSATVYLAAAIVLGIYVVVASWLFKYLTRLNIPRRFQVRLASPREKEARVIGLLLIAVQAAFMVFNLKEGINVAGSAEIKTESPLNLLFVLLQPDMLFFVYYGYFRDSKLFRYNLGVYVLSSFLRGWTGFVLTIAFFEWCRAYRNGRLRIRNVVAFGVAGLLAYPLILSVKWFVRTNPGVAFSDLQTLFDTVNANLGAQDYFEFVAIGLTHLVERLQQVSNVVAMIYNQAILQGMLSSGDVVPFWGEGLPQLAVYKILSGQEVPTLGVALTDVIVYMPNGTTGTWNTSVGLAGWLVVQPLLASLFVAYVLLLCALSVLLAPGSRVDGSVRDMLWYAWLVYLIPGWLMAFTGFLCSLALMNLMMAMLRYEHSPGRYLASTISEKPPSSLTAKS